MAYQDFVGQKNRSRKISKIYKHIWVVSSLHEEFFCIHFFWIPPNHILLMYTKRHFSTYQLKLAHFFSHPLASINRNILLHAILQISIFHLSFLSALHFSNLLHQNKSDMNNTVRIIFIKIIISIIKTE